MAHDTPWWDETEETGLRLCAENSNSTATGRRGREAVSVPAAVTACCWDSNTPGMVGLCGADGSLVLANHDQDRGTTTATTSYAVYFNTLPVHLWGRRRGGGGGGGDENDIDRDRDGNSAQAPPVASTPARRVAHPWSSLSFVPGHPGEVVFVQGWSCRVLWAKLKLEGPISRTRTMPSTSSGLGVGGRVGVAAAERFGLVDGSRVVALDANQAQVQCVSIDSLGQLLLTGDESGSICARLLHPRDSINTSQRAQRGRAWEIEDDDDDGDTACRGEDKGEGEEVGAVAVAEGVGLGGLGAGSGGGGGGGVAKVLQGAHAGAVLAISHVEGSLRLSQGLSEEQDGAGASWSSLFVSGGKGGIVRLWRASCHRRSNEKVHVELVKDMLVGGFQVSCLAASLSLSLSRRPRPQLALILAGTKEGTVFAFHLQVQQDHSNGADTNSQRGGGGGGGGGVQPQIPRSDGTAGKTELSTVLMKFEHTRESIEGVCASREQEVIAVADASGIVRTYRPVPLPQAAQGAQVLVDARDRPGSAAGPAAAAAAGGGGGVLAEQKSSPIAPRPGRHGVAAAVAVTPAGDAPARPFELVVECRLGARPASCEFALGAGRRSRRDRDEDRDGRSGGGGQDDEEGMGRRPGAGAESDREVLRTCTVGGSIQVWPTASLPASPLRPPPTSTPTPLPTPRAHTDVHQVLAPLPPHGPSNAGESASGGGGGGGSQDGSSSPAANGGGQENADPSDPFSRWAASAVDDRGRGSIAGAIGGAGGAGGVGRGEEELTARGKPPVPVPLPQARPAAQRRVSFAPADEVYKLHDPYYSSSNSFGNTTPWSGWETKDGTGDNIDIGDLEAPRPPPPAPTPMTQSMSTSMSIMPSDNDDSRPRRLRQTWGVSASARGDSSSGGSSGSRRGPMGSVSSGDDSAGSGAGAGTFFAPSKLQEASMWSTAVEQVALEQRMREEFDANAVPEPNESLYRGVAAGAVNIHPLARTFEGLVPVSLDAPPPRPKRKGKQVSKSHLSKVQEQRITEDDLAFDGMEPDCSAIAGFGSDSGGRMWPHEELEWYGGRSLFAELDASSMSMSMSMASDRVWSLGRRV